jgi:LPS sulfotransferase NodH
VLPPSVRFWGRKVYWAPVVLLVSALRQGNPVYTFERLKALFGIWRSTVNRWQKYFRDIFAQTIGYRRLLGHLSPMPAAGPLPAALLARFTQAVADPKAALITCLTTLALGP